MTNTLLSMPDLRWRALAEIRQLPGCHNVQDIAINHVTDERAENNWSYVFCSRALLMPTQRPELHSTSKPMLRVSYLP
jgi:hypothetical protein